MVVGMFIIRFLFSFFRALFPCGDHMVCIIDDREDVWNYAPNLISVKPYKFFKGSDDINNPFKPETTNSIGKKVENKENVLVQNNCENGNSTEVVMTDENPINQDDSKKPDKNESDGEKDLEGGLIIGNKDLSDDEKKGLENNENDNISSSKDNNNTVAIPTDETIEGQSYSKRK